MGRASDGKQPVNSHMTSIPDELLANIMQGAGGNRDDDHRIILLHGDVNEFSISQVIGQMLALASMNDRPIHLVLSTYGGSVDEMFSLYDTIGFLPCPVRTIALGKVMSAGVLLLAAGEKGQRLIGKSARIMMHGITSGIAGNVFEMSNDLKEHQRLQRLMEDAVLAETKLTKKQLTEIINTGRDYYVTPEAAIKFGIADKMIGK